MLRFTSAARFKTVTVWGGGLMGGGIAQICAQAGVPTVVVSATGDKERLAATRTSIETSLSRVAKKKFADDAAAAKASVEKVMANLTFTADEKAGAQSELIVEAVAENLEAKRALFAKLDKIAPKESVFATNTSSYGVADIASVTQRADRVIGTHYFSPVPIMRLVEVVHHEKLSQDVFDRVFEFNKKIGKTPIRVSDTPGFLVNRLFVPYLAEAWRLAERGVASYEDIDTAMKLGCGYPMGPFELSDAIGIETLVSILEGWHKQFPEDPLFNSIKSVDKLVAEGKLGKKTGEGFFKYDEKGKRVK